jgi:hypothetical protein
VAIRGSGIQASSASSYTVSWPAGTVAGDLAIIFAAGCYVPSAPAGWTAQYSLSSTFWAGGVYSKVLNSTDISTGHVVVNFSGTLDAVVAIITFVGSYTIQGAFFSHTAGSGSTSVAAPTTTSYGVYNIYFGSNRAASTDTVSRGTLLQQANDGASASGCLYYETPALAPLIPTMLYSVAGTGNMQGTITLVLPAVPVAENIATPLTTPVAGGSKHQIVTAPPGPIGGGGSPSVPVPVAAVLKGGTTGSSYSETINAEGGIAPYTFAVTSGALPTGTTLNASTGVVSGTPTATGTFSFTITATDAHGSTGSTSFVIVIAAPSGGNYGFVN